MPWTLGVTWRWREEIESGKEREGWKEGRHEHRGQNLVTRLRSRRRSAIPFHMEALLPSSQGLLSPGPGLCSKNPPLRALSQCWQYDPLTPALFFSTAFWTMKVNNYLLACFISCLYLQNLSSMKAGTISLLVHGWIPELRIQQHTVRAQKIGCQKSSSGFFHNSLWKNLNGFGQYVLDETENEEKGRQVTQICGVSAWLKCDDIMN